MPRVLLTLVTLYLLGRGGFEVHRSGVLRAPQQVECPGPDGEVPEPQVHRVELRGCAARFDEMMYLRRDEEVVGVLLPLQSARDAGRLSVLLQILEPALVRAIVEDESPIAPKDLPQLSGEAFVGYLLPYDKVSAGRTLRLLERYDDLDPDFRVLELGAAPDWTDGGVMLLFGLLGLVGLRRLGAPAQASEE